MSIVDACLIMVNLPDTWARKRPVNSMTEDNILAGSGPEKTMGNLKMWKCGGVKLLSCGAVKTVRSGAVKTGSSGAVKTGSCEALEL